MSKYYLFYGTLRKNGPKNKTYNFNRFGGQTCVGYTALLGWDMFDLGYYPCIVEGNGMVTFEVHEVTPEAAQSIEAMERGAGYHGRDIKLADGKIARLYYWNREEVEGCEQIKSGDWCKE